MCNTMINGFYLYERNTFYVHKNSHATINSKITVVCLQEIIFKLNFLFFDASFIFSIHHMLLK
jgi:hypothetical protein